MTYASCMLQSNGKIYLSTLYLDLMCLYFLLLFRVLLFLTLVNIAWSSSRFFRGYLSKLVDALRGICWLGLSNAPFSALRFPAGKPSMAIMSTSTTLLTPFVAAEKPPQPAWLLFCVSEALLYTRWGLFESRLRVLGTLHCMIALLFVRATNDN